MSSCSGVMERQASQVPWRLSLQCHVWPEGEKDGTSWSAPLGVTTRRSCHATLYLAAHVQLFMPLYLKQANPNLPLRPSLYDYMIEIFIRNTFYFNHTVYVCLCFVRKAALICTVRIGVVVVGLPQLGQKSPTKGHTSLATLLL